ncbi:MAG: hypothetical protein PW788_05500 [Micavibrio sp.]|nr:hypothetical protein [Micavibrio sp.]
MNDFPPMKDFKDTGLPPDPAVYRAYMTYVKNAEPGPLQEHGLRMAQVLQQTLGNNPDILSLALLSILPPETYGLMGRRFGTEAMEVLEEANKHARTGFAYVEEARPQVKLLATASAIASIEDFDAGLASYRDKVAAFQATGVKPQKLEEPPVPNVRLCSLVARYAFGDTGSDTLDYLLIEKLEDFNMTVEEKLAEFNIDYTAPVDYPGFAKAKLRDEDVVKDAYYVLTTHAMAEDDDIEKALEAAQLLSAEPSASPTAIAAVLLDIGLKGRSPDDLQFLQKRLDWDVLDLLFAHNVREPGGIKELAAAPLEFRQMALAHAAVSMGAMLTAGENILIGLDNGQIPESLGPMLKLNAVMKLEKMVSDNEKIFTPMRSMFDTPELSLLMEYTSDAANEYISKHKDKPMLALPAPKPPKPESGNDFTF